jgi:TetR/AcrR family transcriptional repressor of nem operon
MSPDTRQRLLAEAEILVRTRGYAAFSYADLAERIAIRKASIHYYFPTKEVLIDVLLQEYIARFVDTIDGIGRTHAKPVDRLRAYAQLFLDGFERGLLPLCGALSAERAALPESLRPKVTHFFKLQLDWLTAVIAHGIEAGDFEGGIAPDRTAMLLLSTLEGGSFVGWAMEDKAPVLAAFDAALHHVATTSTKRVPRRAVKRERPRR